MRTLILILVTTWPIMPAHRAPDDDWSLCKWGPYWEGRP